MKKFMLAGIAIILLLGLVGCESRKHKRIKVLMEVGEYFQAMVLLNVELLENVKNVKLRKMLLECHEKQGLWDEVIKQIEIIKKIAPETNYDFLLMRSYSLIKQTEKAQMILKKYPNYIDTLDTQYMLVLVEKVKNTNIPSDSLKDILSMFATINPDTLEENIKSLFTRKTVFFDGDSLLEKKFYYYTKKNESELNKEKIQYYKKKHLDDWYLVGILSELYDDSPYLYSIDDDVEKMLQIDSTYIDYIYDPLMRYANSLTEPDLYDRKYRLIGLSFYYSDFRYYYNNRSKVFELLNLYEKALDEKSNEISWLYCDNECLFKDTSLRILYNDYIVILKEMKDYLSIINFADKKMEIHKKSSIAYKTLKLEKIQALEKTELKEE